MTGLPKSLQKWESSLEALSREAIELLSSWLPRLSAWIGPYPLLRPHHTGEPAGYGDLDRSGDYQHLVISEWLLAEEYPEEFLRRAAHKEHLFYKLTRLESKMERACFVFLDCGPSQLGKARLVQLALLIVMQRIAANAHVRFNWAVIQQPDVIKESLTEEDIRYFLHSPTLDFINTGLLEKCLEHTQSAKNETVEKEVWVVGGKTGKKAADDAGCLFISIEEMIAGLDSDEPEDYFLLQLAGRGQRGRSLHLKMPEEKNCVALLRRPFKPKQKPGASGRTGSLDGKCEILLSDSGKVLFARIGEGNYLAYVLDYNVTGSKQAKPFRVAVTPDEQLLAINFRKGKIIQIIENKEGKIVQKRNRQGEILSSWYLDRMSSSTDVDSSCVTMNKIYISKHTSMFFYIHPDRGRAYCLPYGANLELSGFSPILFNVEKWAASREGAIFAGTKDEAGEKEIYFYSLPGRRIEKIDLTQIDLSRIKYNKLDVHPGDLVTADPYRAIIRSNYDPPFLYFALPLADDKWVVIDSGTDRDHLAWTLRQVIHIPDDHRVLGLYRKRSSYIGLSNDHYSLITLTNRERTLLLVNDKCKPLHIVNEESPIVSLCQCMRSSVIGWTNMLGRVKVFDIDSRTNVLIAHPEVNSETIN